jgi:hypothetical protein
MVLQIYDSINPIFLICTYKNFVDLKIQNFIVNSQDVKQKIFISQFIELSP